MIFRNVKQYIIILSEKLYSDRYTHTKALILTNFASFNAQGLKSKLELCIFCFCSVALQVQYYNKSINA